MPRKIRDLKKDLKRAGFTENTQRGKGSHKVWTHPNVGRGITMPRHDGDDAPPYLERQVRDKIKESKGE